MDGHVGWAELGAVVVAVLAELLRDRTDSKSRSASTLGSFGASLALLSLKRVARLRWVRDAATVPQSTPVNP